MSVPAFNRHGVLAIYRFEMARFVRTLFQSLLTPVITTSLFVIVFGAAIGSRMSEVNGVSYGAFIVPGLVMLSLFTESISNASFGIHFPKFTGTIFEVLSAPVAAFEIVLGYVGAAATKSVVIGLVILTTASFFVDFGILHAPRNPRQFPETRRLAPRPRRPYDSPFSPAGTGRGRSVRDGPKRTERTKRTERDVRRDNARWP